MPNRADFQLPRSNLDIKRLKSRSSKISSRFHDKLRFCHSLKSKLPQYRRHRNLNFLPRKTHRNAVVVPQTESQKSVGIDTVLILEKKSFRRPLIGVGKI